MDRFIGSKKGMLAVIGVGQPYIKKNGDYGCKRYTVRCDCGDIKDMTKGAINNPNTISCGCYNKNKCAELGKRSTHNMSDSPTHKSWVGMKQRCYNPKASGYSYYGAIGISVCSRWMNSFENFIEDMGLRPKGKTLDRKDNNKGYSKSNCRWATPKEQAGNRSSTKLSENDRLTIVKLRKDGVKAKEIANKYSISEAYVYILMKRH